MLLGWDKKHDWASRSSYLYEPSSWGPSTLMNLWHLKADVTAVWTHFWVNDWLKTKPGEQNVERAEMSLLPNIYSLWKNNAEINLFLKIASIIFREV